MNAHSPRFYYVNICIVLLALGGLGITGCGESLPERIKVHGTVTQEGKPLDRAMITFEPIHSGENPPLRPAKGFTDAQGVYRLSSFRTNDGAMPGKYAVLVHMHTGYSVEGVAPTQPTKSIPEKYGRSDTTDLTAIISADSPSDLELNFDLEP